MINSIIGLPTILNNHLQLTEREVHYYSSNSEAQDVIDIDVSTGREITEEEASVKLPLDLELQIRQLRRG